MTNLSDLTPAGFNPRPSVKTGERNDTCRWHTVLWFQSTPVSEDGRTDMANAAKGFFKVSIHARQ